MKYFYKTIFVLCFIFIFFSVYSSKLQLNLITPNSKYPPKVLINNKEIILDKDSYVTENKLILTSVNKNKDSSGNEIQFTAPTTSHNGKLSDKNFFEIKKGDWQIIGDLSNGGKWVSTKINSILFFDGFTSDININFLKHPRGGIANINWNGKNYGDIDLYSPTEIWQTTRLDSSKINYYTILPINTKNITIRNNQNIDNLTITFGNLEIKNINKLQPSSTIIIPINIKFKIFLYLLKNWILFIGNIIYLNFIYLLVGIPISICFICKNSIKNIIFSIISGLSILVIFSTTLGYFVPVKTSLLIITSIFATINIIFLIKNKIKYKLFFKNLYKNRNFVFLFLIGIISVTLFFFPEILKPGWFFGHSKTDTFEYINYAQQFINKSPTSLGFPVYVYRFAERVFLSINAIFSNKTVLASYTTTCATLWFQIPFIFWFLFRKIVKNQNLLKIYTIIFSFSANLYSLFSQSYFAHYFFIFSLIYSLLFFEYLFFIKKWELQKRKIFLYMVISLPIVLSLIIYPYHFLLPISLLIFVILSHKNQHGLFKKLIFISICSFVLLNINLSLIISFFQNKISTNILNDIGRWVVFPFYKSFTTFGRIIFGLLDFNQNSIYLQKILSELIISSFHYINNINILSKITFVFISIISVFGIVVTFIKKNRKSYAFFISLNTIIYMLVSLWLLKNDQVYAYGKLLLTLGVFLTFSLFIGINQIYKIKNKIIIVFCNIFLLIFLFLNLYTQFIENIPNYLNKNSILLYNLKTHLNTNNSDLVKLNDFSINLNKDNNILILGSYQDTYLSDYDRVFINRILEIFYNQNVYIGNCLINRFISYDYYIDNNVTDLQKYKYILIFNGFKRNDLITNQFTNIINNNIYTIYKKNDN